LVKKRIIEEKYEDNLEGIYDWIVVTLDIP
jgi:hypothetical protein